MTLEEATRFVVSTELVDTTESTLRRAGAKGYEVFVLWTGELVSREFLVRRAHVPAQKSYRTEDGLLVRIEGDALHGLNVWMYEQGQRLGAQVHAHPTDAFHSQTDDTFPVVTDAGSLSIVAADFGAHGLLHASSAAYRLAQDGWRSVDLSALVAVAD